jgi:hypothetical protein
MAYNKKCYSPTLCMGRDGKTHTRFPALNLVTRQIMNRFAIVLTMILSVDAFGDFNYDRYEPASLETASANMYVDPRADYFIEAGEFKYLSAGLFTGNYRESLLETSQFIEKWVKALGHPEEYSTMFKYEVEIEQNGQLYWLPLQNGLVDAFATEVCGGCKVSLYIMTAGSIKQGRVFFINEFKAN